MYLDDPKMMMQQPIKAPMNPISCSIDHDRCFGQALFQWWQKGTQYNHILQHYLGYHEHFRTSSLSNESKAIKKDKVIRTVPVKHMGKDENLLKRTEQEPSMQWNECKEHRSQWRSHQSEQHTRLGEWCREASKRFSSTWFAGICPCSPSRQFTTKLDWKLKTMGLDASISCHITCLIREQTQNDAKVPS